MNKPSGKISPEENSKVFEMLGDRRQSLSTAVVQLLLANQNSTRQWQLVVTGVACFVKDSVRRGYFIQVFDMDSCQRIWEQELYNEMIYKNPTSTFHTFEGDSTTVGLSFADNREAEEFKAAVNERIEKIRSRAERRTLKKENKRYSQEISAIQSKEVELDHNGNEQIDSRVNSINDETHHGKKVKRGWSLKMKKSKSKSRLSKDDISLPEAGTFVHINGVASSDFHVSEPNNIPTKKSNSKSFKRPPPPPPPHARQETVCISNNCQTESNMIFKVLNQELVNSNRESTNIRKKSGPPSYIPPPPPPPPKMASSTVKSQGPLPPLPKKVIYPKVTSDVRANLMEEIRSRGGFKGIELKNVKKESFQKHTVPDKASTHSAYKSVDEIDTKYKPKLHARIPPPPPPPPNTPARAATISCKDRFYALESPTRFAKTDTSARCFTESHRNELLEAIRLKGGLQGRGLRHVQPADKISNSDTDSTSSGSLYNVLAGALSNIKYATCNSDSSESSTSEEWSDEEGSLN